MGCEQIMLILISGLRGGGVIVDVTMTVRIIILDW